MNLFIFILQTVDVLQNRAGSHVETTSTVATTKRTTSMTLKLPIEGFGSSEGLANPGPGQYGIVEFVFEMICQGECTLKFKEVNLINQPYSIHSYYSLFFL